MKIELLIKKDLSKPVYDHGIIYPKFTLNKTIVVHSDKLKYHTDKKGRNYIYIDIRSEDNKVVNIHPFQQIPEYIKALCEKKMAKYKPF